MSYTGTGANAQEHPILQGVEQGRYPQESATRVTSTGNVTLPAPQSSGWETRTGHGSYVEELQERTARQEDHVDAYATQTSERTAQPGHSARKRKECPTEEGQKHNRSRHMECTQTTAAVHTLLEADSISPPVNTLSRPNRESGWIQHRGQPRDRTLMARERGSTGYSSGVTEAGRMAASLRKILATASLTTTSREVIRSEHENEEQNESQRLSHKQGGSGGIGGVG